MSADRPKRPDRRRRRNTAPLASRASDAAERLGLSASGLRKLIREGHISAIRIKRAVLIRETELERFLAENETRAAS